MINTKDVGWVRIIRLDDSQSLNSLSESLSRQLFAEFQAAADDSAVRALVVTGEGRAFCSGGNVKDFLGLEIDRGDYVSGVMDDLYNPLALLLADYPKPIVVAMNGPAIGAGVGLALNSDYILSSEDAYFSLPFLPKLGIVPDMGSAWLLAQAIGQRRALSLSMTGEKLSAARAQEWGVVDQILPAEQLEDEALAVANRLGGLPLRGFSRLKQLIKGSRNNSLAENLQLERELQVPGFREDSFVEGLSALMERRAPDFSQFN